MRYVANQNAPQVKFVRIHGRIVPIVGGKKSRKAGEILNENLERMKIDVEIAEPGRRIGRSDGSWSGIKSTFPQHFRDAGFKTRNEWMSAYNKGEGQKFEKILNYAKNDRAFQTATKQVYDNRLVLFRNIDNKIRPIKVKSLDEYKFYSGKG